MPFNENLVIKSGFRLRCCPRNLFEAVQFSERSLVLKKGLNGRGDNKKYVEIRCLVTLVGTYCFSFFSCCR